MQEFFVATNIYDELLTYVVGGFVNNSFNRSVRNLIVSSALQCNLVRRKWRLAYKFFKATSTIKKNDLLVWLTKQFKKHFIRSRTLQDIHIQKYEVSSFIKSRKIRKLCENWKRDFLFILIYLPHEKFSSRFAFYY